MMSNETFTKGQVVWAIWRALSNYAPETGQPNSQLTNRIKRLLDLDRTKHHRGEPLAFVDRLPGSRGVNVAFSKFDAFTLLLGIELLDIGLTQADVVFLIREIRDELKTHFDHIMSDPPPARGQIRAEERETRPTFVRSSPWEDGIAVQSK